VDLQNVPEASCEHRGTATQAVAQVEVAFEEAASMKAVADNFLRAWQSVAPDFQQA
jgi:hypothetical protein